MSDVLTTIVVLFAFAAMPLGVGLWIYFDHAAWLLIAVFGFVLFAS